MHIIVNVTQNPGTRDQTYKWFAANIVKRAWLFKLKSSEKVRWR